MLTFQLDTVSMSEVERIVPDFSLHGNSLSWPVNICDVNPTEEMSITKKKYFNKFVTLDRVVH